MAMPDAVVKQRIDSLIDEGSALYNTGERKEALDRLAQAWQLLPAPKEIYDDSFHIAHYSTKIALAEKNYELASYWAKILQHCDPERIDSGHREFIAGQVAFESGDLETAKNYFMIAWKKSNGRVFREQDKKYRRSIGM